MKDPGKMQTTEKRETKISLTKKGLPKMQSTQRQEIQMIFQKMNFPKILRGGGREMRN